MTIVRSLGVTTLVALMSAHRAATQEECSTTARPFEQAAVDAIEAYLWRTEDSNATAFWTTTTGQCQAEQRQAEKFV